MMKNKMPSEGLRLGRDSGSILCDTLKKVAFSDSLGGGKILCVSNIVINILVLGIFKYYNFFVDSFISAFSLLGVELHHT